MPAVVTVKLLPVTPVLQVTVPVHVVAVNTADSVIQISVLLAVTVGAAGFPPVVIVTTDEATLVPQALLHVAVYVPAVDTDNVLPVAPELQVTVPEQPVAVKVAVSVPQRLVLFAATFGAEGAPPDVIVTTADAGLVPQVFLQVAVYVPAVFTLMLLLVAPVLHVIVPEQFEAVSVAVSVPHKLVLSATILGAVGVIHPPQSAFALIMIDVDAALVPQVFVQIAVYVPTVETVSVLPVEPLLQVTVPEHPVAVNIADSVVQISVLLAERFGAEGFPPLVITTLSDGRLVPQSFLHVAV